MIKLNFCIDEALECTWTALPKVVLIIPENANREAMLRKQATKEILPVEIIQFHDSERIWRLWSYFRRQHFYR